MTKTFLVLLISGGVLQDVIRADGQAELDAALVGYLREYADVLSDDVYVVELHDGVLAQYYRAGPDDEEDEDHA